MPIFIGATALAPGPLVPTVPVRADFKVKFTAAMGGFVSAQINTLRAAVQQPQTAAALKRLRAGSGCRGGRISRPLPEPSFHWSKKAGRQPAAVAAGPGLDAEGTAEVAAVSGFPVPRCPSADLIAQADDGRPRQRPRRSAVHDHADDPTRAVGQLAPPAGTRQGRRSSRSPVHRGLAERGQSSRPVGQLAAPDDRRPRDGCPVSVRRLHRSAQRTAVIQDRQVGPEAPARPGLDAAAGRPRRRRAAAPLTGDDGRPGTSVARAGFLYHGSARRHLRQIKGRRAVCLSRWDIPARGQGFCTTLCSPGSAAEVHAPRQPDRPPPRR